MGGTVRIQPSTGETYIRVNKGNVGLQSPKAECYELLGLEPPWLKGPWGAVESGQMLLNL